MGGDSSGVGVRLARHGDLLHAFSFAGRVAPLARQAEEWGFDGLLVADSQNLNADVWMELALAAAATDRIGLGPGVRTPSRAIRP